MYKMDGIAAEKSARDLLNKNLANAADFIPAKIVLEFYEQTYQYLTTGTVPAADQQS